MVLYQLLNYAEACLWLIAAITLRKIIPIKSKQHNTACHIATIGFILFSISDILEASLTRQFYLWLWLLKIGCGIIFIISRVYYVGIKDFKLNDRYFIFFTLCLCAAIAIIWLTLSAQPTS